MDLSPFTNSLHLWYARMLQRRLIDKQSRTLRIDGLNPHLYRDIGADPDGVMRKPLQDVPPSEAEMKNRGAGLLYKPRQEGEET
ncbi:hypothetical protein [Aliagarivorans taiwanensis]|uniref:hypothetical protein n=1 Tax=Aliagarivorans taiwanensis TaxID=561966 RepID=UPI0003F92FED|nr:hypothetical protein [Aliagarivorans taiwanensis]